jgi:hypothetical protein
MALTTQTRYLARGFIPINETPRTKTIPMAAVSVIRGDALHRDAADAGWATNANVVLTGTFLGIAANSIDNTVVNTLAKTTGVAGTAYVEYYPFESLTSYIVPVQNALATQAAVGTYVNLITNAGLISLAVLVTEGIAFFIEEIDVSAAAIVGNAFGYALGRFRLIGTQAP